MALDRPSPRVGEQLDAGDDDPSDPALNSGLEVFGEAAVARAPAPRAIAGRQNEALGRIDASDNLDGPLPELAERGFELVAGAGGVGEQMTQPGEGVADRFDHHRRTIAVLHVRRRAVQPKRPTDGLQTDGIQSEKLKPRHYPGTALPPLAMISPGRRMLNGREPADSDHRWRAASSPPTGRSWVRVGGCHE
jgi:hypothetical protein